MPIFTVPFLKEVKLYERDVFINFTKIVSNEVITQNMIAMALLYDLCLEVDSTLFENEPLLSNIGKWRYIHKIIIMIRIIVCNI